MLSNSNSAATQEVLKNYYQELEGFNLAPLWNVQEEALVDEPTSKASPHIWRWKDLEPRAIRAGELIGTADAERRVLMLLNPTIKDRIATTNSLFSGLQIVMPGEAARAHRHTPSALRFIINSDGGYTTVNGDRIPMYPGDLVLTPSWTWHDHGNESGEPIIWLDGLDIPLVHLLEAVFFEPYPEDVQPVTEPIDSSTNKYGAGTLRPLWEDASKEAYSPLMRYPWEQTWAALQRLAPEVEGSPFDGVIMEYTNPNTGGPVMPTIACHVQMLRPGESTRAHRHTNSTIYHVVQGQGYSVVHDQKMDWEPKDVFCVPGWTYHEHVNASQTEPAVLFSFTDTPVLKSLSLLREQARPQDRQ